MTPRILRFSILAGFLIAAPAGHGSGLVLPDLAIRETPDGLQVFVADPARGRLFSGTLPRDARSVPVLKLDPVTPCGPMERVVAVTVRGSRLVAVTGEGNPVVTECNLETKETVRLHAGEPLRAPASIAIAADGSVAVLDRALRSVIVISRQKRPTVVRVSSAPLMMRADDLGQLYVVDLEAGGVLPIQVSEYRDPSLGSSSMAVQQTRGNTPFLALPVVPASFAVFRDVFYVAEQSGTLRAQLSGGRLSLEIPDVRPRQAAVAASRNYLATIDREAASVEIMDRPLPAGVVLDPIRGNPNEAWLQLLEYMAEKRLLTRDRVKVTSEDNTYEALLKRTGVLLEVDARPEKVVLPPGRTNELFCALNPTVCKEGYSAQLPYVVIPQVAPQPVLQTETTQLQGRDVKSWVEERVLLASHKRDVTDAYLATRNPSVAASLETELLRRKMVMATPMDERLTAGTIIRIVDGREQIVGPISVTCDGLAPTTGKTSLITQLSAPGSAVPIGAFAPGAQRAQLSVGLWMRSTISTAALEKCRPGDDAPDRYVITESLAVANVKFEPVGLPPTGKGPASFPQLPGPLYVGYRAVPISGLSAGVALPAEPERLKPTPPAAAGLIWSISSGSFALPVTRWRADVLLPTADFYAPNSRLRRLQAEQRAVDLSPRERLERAALSSHVHEAAGFRQDVPLAIASSREGLVKAIKYDEQLAGGAGTEDVYIGIVEHSASVNPDHAGFVLDNQSAWYDFVPTTGTLEPHRPRPPEVTPPTLHRVNRDTEHGTHVAGTIAARRPPALTLGLLPKTRLFLVPSDSMSDLKTWIQTARDQFVYLFNMSLGFTPATPPETIEDLHGRIQEGWKDALFVVAAGNDGADLNAVGAQAPVFWASSLPNVMTVGASDDRGDNVLGQHQDGDDPEERKGSNFGSRYVDLLAPGQLVHSFGRDSYAYACGSSHAAPQVTATAAMLWTRFNKPEVLRARLIYTADWKEPNFNKKVWGGLLNVKRAVFAPKNNVFIKAGADTTPHEIKPAANATVRIDGDIQERDGRTTPLRDEHFPFNRVLRIESLGAGRSRIVLLSRTHGVLTIMKGTIQGSVTCESVKKADKEGQFSLAPDVPVNCQQGFPLGQIKDYVGATPAAVRFQ